MKKSIYLLLFSLSLLAVSACKEEGPLEKAGKSTDRAIEDAGDSLEDAGDKIEEETSR